MSAGLVMPSKTNSTSRVELIFEILAKIPIPGRKVKSVINKIATAVR